MDDNLMQGEGFIKIEAIPEWSKDPIFKKFWKHYKAVNDWHIQNTTFKQSKQHDKHFKQSALAFSYHSSYLMWYNYMTMMQKYQQLLMQQKLLQNNCIEHFVPASPCQQTAMAKSSTSRSHKKKRERSNSTNCSKRQKPESRLGKLKPVGMNDIVFDVDASVLNQEDEIIECHMEITDEMLEFFAQSARHREERDAHKEEAETVIDEYVDISRVNAGTANPTTQAPKEQPGKRRTDEMKILFGTGAPMIHGMETALQLAYDRHLDLHQSKLWPHLPINIKF